MGHAPRPASPSHRHTLARLTDVVHEKKYSAINISLNLSELLIMFRHVSACVLQCGRTQGAETEVSTRG